MIDKVTLERGREEQRPVLDALAQLYMHDFTEFLDPKRQIYPGEDGRFDDGIGLEAYWTKPDHSVWFIRADDALAGFALLDAKTHSGEPADYNMAQFFVARPYRGRDVAARAVAGILNKHPGQWEAAVMEGNVPALRFWPRAIAGANISELETMHDNAGETKRMLFRFVVGS